MRFGTGVMPMGGLLAAPGRLAAATATAGWCRGGQRELTYQVPLTAAELPRSR